MTLDQLNKEVAAEINRLPEDDSGRVMLDDTFFGDVPPTEVFLEPPPDVFENFPENPDDGWLVDWRERHPFLLGIYIPMNSPGQVILFGNNLRRFYKSLLREITPSIPYLTKLDMSAAWSLVLMKTHTHEFFHYYCDILHGLFGGSYICMIEEALAVAWARNSIHGQRTTWNTQIGRMNGQLYSSLMKRAFAYHTPGYDDWVHYADDIRFKPALVDYMSPGDFRKLRGNGVDVELLINSMLTNCRGGVVEKVW